MIKETFTCARPECDNVGTKTTHNQKYCSPRCTRIATNLKIMEKYHERAAIRKGKPRACRECGTSLSRYNENTVCSPCASQARKSVDVDLQSLVSSVIWL